MFNTAHNRASTAFAAVPAAAEASARSARNLDKACSVAARSVRARSRSAIRRRSPSHRGRAYLIELKAADGVLSEAQKAFIAAGLCAAVDVGVACTLEQVLALIDSWQFPATSG